MSGTGEAASQAASGEDEEVPTIIPLVYPPWPSCCSSKTKRE